MEIGSNTLKTNYPEIFFVLEISYIFPPLWGLRHILSIHLPLPISAIQSYFYHNDDSYLTPPYQIPKSLYLSLSPHLSEKTEKTEPRPQKKYFKENLCNKISVYCIVAIENVETYMSEMPGSDYRMFQLDCSIYDRQT